MKRKQVLLLWIIAALLGAAVASVKVRQNHGPASITKLSRGDRLFQDTPLGDLTIITVADGTQSVTLQKGENGWTVNERDHYPANVAMLAGLFDKLNEVKVGQAMEAGASYDARFGMDPTATTSADHGLLLTLTQAGETAPLTIALGKVTNQDATMMNPIAGGGRFIRLGTDPGSIYVVEETFPRVTAAPKDWLTEEFLQISKLKEITLQAPDDEGFEPWTLTREDATSDFSLKGLSEEEELITTVLAPLKNLFSFARFEDVLPAEDATALRDDSNARQATLTTFDGFSYTVEIAPKKSDSPLDSSLLPASSQFYLMGITVNADLPAARTPGEDESAEDKTRLDEEFTTQQKALKERLAKEQALQNYVFEVTKWTVDALLKARAEFVRPKGGDPIPPPVAPPGLGDTFGFPTGR